MTYRCHVASVRMMEKVEQKDVPPPCMCGKRLQGGKDERRSI